MSSRGVSKLMSEPWNVPITLSDDGTRAVIETNWEDSKERCQMIWKAQDNGDVLITTCRPDTPAIRINPVQMRGLAFFLKNLVGGVG